MKRSFPCILFLPGLVAFLVAFLFTSCKAGTSGDHRKNFSGSASESVITWWSNNRASRFNIDMEELPVYRELQKQTGITVDFIHPPEGQYDLRFKLMLGTGNFPDIISHDFLNNYPGGIAGAINDGLILPLDEELLKAAPNLTKWLNDHPLMKQQLSTPEGDVICFPSLNSDLRASTYMGPFVRNNYLKKHKLSQPVTIAQWEQVLTRFKEDPEIDIPLSFYGGNFRDTRFLISAFGIDWSLFRDESGNVQYGPALPAFQDFLALFQNWYQRELMDPGVVMDNRRTYEGKTKKKHIGIYVDYLSRIWEYQTELQKGDPQVQLIPLANPKQNTLDPPSAGHDAGFFIPFASAYITPAAQDPKQAVQLLDYGWSPEGMMLFNYGIEGESYTRTGDGEAIFMPSLFQKNGTGSFDYYICSGPYLKDGEAFLQSLILPSQRDAIRLWSSRGARVRPLELTLYKSGEEQEVMKMVHRMDDYVFSLAIDIISGKSSLDLIQDLPQTLEEMGLEEVLQYYGNT